MSVGFRYRSSAAHFPDCSSSDQSRIGLGKFPRAALHARAPGLSCTSVRRGRCSHNARAKTRSEFLIIDTRDNARVGNIATNKNRISAEAERCLLAGERRGVTFFPATMCYSDRQRLKHGHRIMFAIPGLAFRGQLPADLGKACRDRDSALVLAAAQGTVGRFLDD